MSIVDDLNEAGLRRGGLLALTIAPGVGLGLALSDGWSIAIASQSPADIVRSIEIALRPRWVVWGSEPALLVDAGLRLTKCWHTAAVQRLLTGGWRMDPARAWAQLHDLPTDRLPVTAPVDLFTEPDDGEPDEPLRADGYLKPEWLAPDFEWTTGRLARWATLAIDVANLQDRRLELLDDRPMARSVARSESAAELLCAELAHDGLPMDRAEAESIVASFVGPRPLNEADAVERRRARDDEVLRHATSPQCDLRNPAQVKSLLRSIGVELPDTRAWRLEAIRDSHPLIEALLEWRKAERMATTFGYSWLDEHLGADGRLRGDVVGQRRRRRSYDCVGGAAQHAGTSAVGSDRRARPCLRACRPRADRAAHPRGRLGRCSPCEGNRGG